MNAFRQVVSRRRHLGTGIGLVGISLAFGLTVLAGVFAFGHISGGHFNPSVTIGLATAKRVPWSDVLPYVVTQIVAAIAASGTLWVIAVNQKGQTADRRPRHRLRAHPDPPSHHPRHRHLREPRPLHRPCADLTVRR